MSPSPFKFLAQMPTLHLFVHSQKVTGMKKMLTQMFILACVCSGVSAENLNFNFMNPSFIGGNPNNAPGLLNQANAQNPYKAPVDTALQKFQKNMESAIFSRIQSKLLEAQFGKEAPVVGDYDTLNFRINVSDAGNNLLVVTTTDKITGAVTTFTVDTSQ